MGKTGKWFKSFWTGKKDQSKKRNTSDSVTVTSSNQQNQSQNGNGNENHQVTAPVVIPRPATPTKEKKRWSFRRSSTVANPSKDPDSEAVPPTVAPPPHPEEKLPALAPAEEEEEAVDEVAPVALADVGVIDIEEAAAIKIQAVFRSYLARKALKALRGLVKLQALVRGHLVRKQATATLRSMQALVTAQARARIQRIRSAEDAKIINHRHSTHWKIKHPYQEMEENIKIVEMDKAEYYKPNIKSRNSYSNSSEQQWIDERIDDKISTYYTSQRAYSKQDPQQLSPAPSGLTDMSPRTFSGHFEDYSYATAQSSPHCYSTMCRPSPHPFPRADYADPFSYDYPLYPNYMANTESSRAKVRSQSAPKQRPEFERQPSRGRRASVEGRGIPRAARMQRSSSHVGSGSAQNVQYPWSVKLDKSNISLKESECGSNCSVFTNPNYCRSLMSYDVTKELITDR